jgi:nicotinamidase-related amidase
MVLLVALPTTLHAAEEHAVCEHTISLSLQTRSADGTPKLVRESWRPNETAVIVCDMWDLHHCHNAVKREAEMAPRMNELIEKARGAGAFVIHAPSGCMKAYEGHPARERAKTAPRAASLPDKIGQWCKQIPAEEKAIYPIDQTDGGEDDDPVDHAAWAKQLAAQGLNPRSPWTRQTDALRIAADTDAISDSGVEIWNLLEARRIRNVILMGVHVNMCVAGRPFGLRQMAKNGKHVVLVRDMTDSMYNPARWPYVDHFRGTALFIEHVEKYICPTITSDQFIGGQPFVFSAAVTHGPSAGGAPLAHYTFAEGAGPMLGDHSGNGYDGTIHGARWVKTAAGTALRFGSGDYVDLGTRPEFNLPGDRTITAWVKLECPSFPEPMTNWVIFDGGDAYRKSGYLFRIDGGYARVTYRHCSQTKGLCFCISRRTVENNTWYHLVITRQGDAARLYMDGLLDLQFKAHDSSPAGRPFTISQADQSFKGLMDDLAVYRRAMPTEEIIRLFRDRAAAHGKDVSWIGAIQLVAYGHYDQGNIAVEANFAGILPLVTGQQASLELGLPGEKPLRVEVIKKMPAGGCYECTFPVANLPKDRYQISALVRSADGQVARQSAAMVPIHYEPVVPPSPVEKTAGPLPKPPEPPPYRIELGAGGGFQLAVGDETYTIESAFSWPNGEFNTLAMTPAEKSGCEPAWKVATRKLDNRTYRISASGRFYALQRTIRLFPSHVNVQDTLTNTSDDAVGIILKDSVLTKGKNIASACLAGADTRQPKFGSQLQSNPTVFLKKDGLGIGLVALDDVFIVQSRADFAPDRSTLYSTQFALDKGATYTVEWSVYLNRSADYYDFINAIRNDEGRNGRVDGGMALFYDRYLGRRAVPAREYVSLRNIKYLNCTTMDHPADDPQVSLGGIEFLGYPKEMAMVKEQIASIHKLHPELRVMFHVAHSLYATNKPAETFPDSRVIRADGKQGIYYEGQEGAHLSEKRKKQGWRWYAVYPTLDNSFGRELMRSADVIVDEMGCNGVFMDGFMTAYGGQYTYDRWDGHTADIDPATHTIKRKAGSVLLLSQNALAAFSRKMRDKGAQVVANNSVITRTIGREISIIWDQELVEGPWTHLAPTSVTLSNAYNFSNEREFYYDALNKLKWGSLSFYYGDYPNNGKDMLTHPPLVAQEFPITFEELHPDYVKGRERLITAKPGIYGWAGDCDLHFTHRYDAQGWEIPAGFLTTVEGGGVRTEVTLGRREAAVVKKVPVRLIASGPVNVIFRQYDRAGIAMGLNGKSDVHCVIRSGEFNIEPGRGYLIKADKQRRVEADRDACLAFSCRLDSPLEVTVEPAER